MSLDEIRKRLEAQKQKDEQKKQQRKAKKDAQPGAGETPKIRKGEAARGETIEGLLGDLTVLLTQEHVNSLLRRIWGLDASSNPEMDDEVAKEFEKDAVQFRIKLDKGKLIEKIRANAFFRFSDGNLLSYNTFRQDWQNYVGPDREIVLTGKRKEFVQLLTNRYKNHWVNHEGQALSEDYFQLLYRLERESKGMERIFEFIEDNYLSLIRSTSFDEFLRQMRVSIAKIIKEQLMNFIKIEKKG